ncbi:hypothetical protein G3545_19140 [Starkeya sp. ORNL1]|uniref:hypothetical protein n=1 Tax=Starkeya sp. ORNL1 TaxID=2709380 RepID=UPI001462A915|nr:hypothetical protein [Starkeya sp. ORNL1]QJP15588.1 hypothetical protein G3545_19140 [Starkeya sp. ORNL1]
MRNQDMKKVADLVRDVFRAEFDKVEIVGINAIQDKDRDGDSILRIEVVFKGDLKNFDASKLSGATRRLIPRLSEIDESAFPLFSFLSQKEAKGMRFEAA